MSTGQLSSVAVRAPSGHRDTPNTFKDRSAEGGAHHPPGDFSTRHPELAPRLAHQHLAWRQIVQGRCLQVLVYGTMITGRQRHLGQQRAAAGGRQMAGQLARRAQVAE
jgi:hypothetical protein